MNATVDSKLILTVAAVAVALYWLAKREAGAAAGEVGGLISGTNAITRGTVYEGAGIFGTLGAATNAASGGLLQKAGESLGGWLYDLTHQTMNPATKSAWDNLIEGTH